MFEYNKEFFPTPRTLINKMLDWVDFKTINSVLEPSAGKGDIADSITDKFKYSRSGYYNREAIWDIDTIEIDKNLRYILDGKNYRVIHDDFLTFNTYKRYDLIAMNPPFSDGDKHLLKAIQMQESGGKIACILNAETLNNLCTNTRKELNRKLDQYNASIEYIPDAFIDAERKTYVEIALIKIDIPKTEYNSVILDNLKQDEQFRNEQHNNNQIIDSDFIKGVIQQYNYEVKAGLNLIAEYEALQPLMMRKISNNCNNCILELNLRYKDDDNNCSMANSYIKQLRMKYWEALFTSEQFMGLFTTNLKEKYYNMVNKLRNYDFSLFNIYTIKNQLNSEMVKGVEDTILALFDEFSHKHYWDEDQSKNIHYYNGWKTNKAWKINNKVIVPYLNAFDTWDQRFKPTDYKVVEKLSDIEKVFNYLDGGKTEDIDIEQSLRTAEKNGQTKKIPLKYFNVTFYKKGTCHIEFTNEELLHKFNVFGSQRKGWIPPSYGKAKYKDMTPEEKQVIDDFEGELSYNRVMNNKDYYIFETNKLLLLA